MKRIGRIALTAWIACVIGSLLTYANSPKEEVVQLTNEISDQVIDWRRDFHSHPELSNREERTGRRIAELLKQIGVDDIKTGVAHHGVVALIKGDHPGPTVGLRADIDALPVTEKSGVEFASQNEGVMHACGHDVHTAVLLGTAKVLSQMRDEIHGTVKLVFQPAEEGAPPGEEGGASLMVKEGVLENPDVSAMFALHISPDLEVGKLGYGLGGVMAAVDQFEITVKGKQSHAAYPWKGIDPIVTSAHIITSLQTIVSRVVDAREPAVVTVGIINGGQRWNIIPDEVKMEGTVRTHSDEVRNQIREKFKQIVHKTAETYNASAEITYHSYGTVTWNDIELGKKMLPTLESIVGEENVIEKKPSMGGEDFAYFAQKVPGFYIRLGVRNEEIGAVHALHTPYLKVDEDAIPIGIQVMSLFALDYLNMQNN